MSADRPLDSDPLADAPTEVDPAGASSLDMDPPPRPAAEIDALVTEGMPIVRLVARHVARIVGALADFDDLASVGREALFDAARTFDPARSSFSSHARRRIKWAMLDAVRRDTHGRVYSDRARAVSAAERVVEALAPDRPGPEQPESAHASTLREVIAAQAAAMATALSSRFVDEPSTTGEHPAAQRTPPRGAHSGEPSPEDAVLGHHRGVALRRAVAALDPKHRQIVERHYFGGERFDEIAASMGVSKSWVSRLHAQAMVKLAGAMRDH